MKTSYFGRANSKAFSTKGLRFVSIARSCKWWDGETYPDLFPTWAMINMKDAIEYKKAYTEQVLSKLDPLTVYQDLHDAVLRCHEKCDDVMSGKKFLSSTYGWKSNFGCDTASG